jgi:hypothetical protein
MGDRPAAIGEGDAVRLRQAARLAHRRLGALPARRATVRAA